MKRIPLLLLTLLIAGFTCSAFSFNFDFLHDSATKKFDEEDWKLQGRATDKAFQSLINKKEVWSNPKTKHHGYIQPLSKHMKEGKPCRKLRIVNHADHQKDHYIFTFCKFGESWKIVH